MILKSKDYTIASLLYVASLVFCNMPSSSQGRVKFRYHIEKLEYVNPMSHGGGANT